MSLEQILLLLFLAFALPLSCLLVLLGELVRRVLNARNFIPARRY